jgi:hypothetical protein
MPLWCSAQRAGEVVVAGHTVAGDGFPRCFSRCADRPAQFAGPAAQLQDTGSVTSAMCGGVCCIVSRSAMHISELPWCVELRVTRVSVCFLY